MQPPLIRVVLDACVLVPPVLREVLLAVAGQGLFEPLWSAKLLQEWVSAAGKTGPAQRLIAGAEAARLALHWPGALVTQGPFVAVAPAMPDQGDLHLLETAVTGGASLILTLNLRDFPTRALTPFGLQALDPDRFLHGLWLDHPDPVAQAAEEVRQEAARLSGAAVPMRPLLKRTGLPRLARALVP